MQKSEGACSCEHACYIPFTSRKTHVSMCTCIIYKQVLYLQTHAPAAACTPQSSVGQKTLASTIEWICGHIQLLYCEPESFSFELDNLTSRVLFAMVKHIHVCTALSSLSTWQAACELANERSLSKRELVQYQVPMIFL